MPRRPQSKPSPDWQLDPERIVMIGYSAGANLIINLANKADAPQPNRILLAGLWRNNQAIKDFGLHPEIPPALLLATKDDRTAQATEPHAALRKHGIPAQLKIYHKGGHMTFNFPSPPAADWPDRLRTWLKTNLPPAPCSKP